ncbi:hypothetical protein DSO57_1015649 [Entomophthora muscae]|uniref:Uncharacterized protein n=1 Tax=Entomophthora muscae TaxID=34485 RepID=A0ACC2TFV9_9FUNG|nr:hypothetical protein DSO57_1015649 [Entomophthora muscae]
MSTKTKATNNEGDKDGCKGPTYTEVMRNMYSCYLGDDFMAGVDKLQEEHPQLKPVVLVSSLFSLIPLLCFGVCVAGIFTTNMVLGVFSIKCYRIMCYVPKFENASQAMYYKFEGYSQAMLASFQERFSKKQPEEEDDATVQNSDDDNGKIDF